MKDVLHFLSNVSNGLPKLNLFVSGIMVVAIAWGFFLLAHSYAPTRQKHKGRPLPKVYPGFPSALLCWLWWWLILLAVYSLIDDPATYWIVLLLDGFGNIALVATALCLLPENKALPSWKFAGYILSSSLTLLSWNLLLGARFPTAGPHWKMVVSSVGILLAAGAFVFLAIAAANRFKQFTGHIWLVCAPYALLQVPAYFYLLINPGSYPKEAALIQSWLAIGKIMFILLFLYILLVEMGISTKAGITKIVMNSLNALLVVLTVIQLFK